MSKPRVRLPFDIASVERSNLIPALEAVRGCLKTASMLWMHALGLPVLSGVVVSNWSKGTASVVRRFSTQQRSSELLLRIDKRNDRWTQRRGGYLISLSQIPTIIRELSREGFIAALPEPASPYADQYSLAGVTIPEQNRLVVEIVGPGFDASDILRGDLQAHERWELAIGTSRGAISGRQIGLITAEEYTESVRQRLAKIGARIRNPAFPDKAQKNATTPELIDDAAAFLKKNRQTTLFRHSEIYIPIPEKYVSSFARLITQLLMGLSGYGIHLGSSSFAASVIPKRGLVFWDFFPARKQESASLYPAAQVSRVHPR